MTIAKIFQGVKGQELGVAQKIAKLLEEIPNIDAVKPFPLVLDNIPIKTGFLALAGADSSETMGGRQSIEWKLILKFTDNLSGDSQAPQKIIADLLEENPDTSIIGKLKTTKTKSRSSADNPNSIGYIARVFRLDVEYGQGSTDKPFVIIHGTINTQV